MYNFTQLQAFKSILVNIHKTAQNMEISRKLWLSLKMIIFQFNSKLPAINDRSHPKESFQILNGISQIFTIICRFIALFQQKQKTKNFFLSSEKIQRLLLIS